MKSFGFLEPPSAEPIILPPSAPTEVIDALLIAIRHFVSCLLKALVKVFVFLLNTIIGNLLNILTVPKPGNTEIDIDQLFEQLIGLNNPSPPLFSIVTSIIKLLNIDGSKILLLIPPLLSKTTINLDSFENAVIDNYDNQPQLLYQDVIDDIINYLVQDYSPSI